MCAVNNLTCSSKLAYVCLYKPNHSTRYKYIYTYVYIKDTSIIFSKYLNACKSPIQ